MNRQIVISAIVALLVGLSGGATATYSWLRTPQHATARTGGDAHADDHEGDELAEHGDEIDDHESVVHLTQGQMDKFGIEMATAGPGTLATRLSLPGKVTLNEDRVAHIVLRAPGIVREVLKTVGDTVHAGEVMAWIESAELGDAKVDFLAKWAEVGCCTIDLTRAREVHDNTLALLQTLKSAPSLEKLREMNGIAMGDNRSALVSAYAEFVFAQAAYEREQSLLKKKVSSETDHQEAEAAYRKADAEYAAARDSIEFKVQRDLLEAKRAQQVREMELRGAERRLYVFGLTAEDIADLRLLAQGQAYSADTEAKCNDPDCKGCAEHRVKSQDTVDAALSKGDERLAWYPLCAPFDGAVIEKHLTLGEKHGDDSDIFTIADLSSVWVDISVYQKDLSRVKTGQRVHISAGEGAPGAQGAISFVAPLVDEKTRTALARVVLPNPQGEWRPGLFVTAELSVDQEDAPVVIPKTAVQRVGGNTVVFMEADDGLIPVPVALGRSNPTHVEICSGLRSGERYVARGAFELKAKIVTSGLGAHAGHGH